MDLIDIEAGPWGGFILLTFLALAIAALWFTTWIVSGILLVLVVLVPIALVVYFGGRRIARRLVHGSG